MAHSVLKKTLLMAGFILTVVVSYSQEEKYISLYLYNFTKYIEWPDEYQEGDFVIDVLGHSSVYERLDKMLSDKKRGSQNFVVNNPSSVEEINANCHILFVGHWKSQLMDEAQKKVGEQGTLIVTEKKGMLKQGAAINLVIKNKKIKYEVQTSEIKHSGLSYSNDLTRLAEQVVK